MADRFLKRLMACRDLPSLTAAARIVELAQDKITSNGAVADSVKMDPARVIAQTTRQAPSEDCFLAALLQDIGLLALTKVQPDLYDDLDALPQHDHAQLIV